MEALLALNDVAAAGIAYAGLFLIAFAAVLPLQSEAAVAALLVSGYR